MSNDQSLSYITARPDRGPAFTTRYSAPLCRTWWTVVLNFTWQSYPIRMPAVLRVSARPPGPRLFGGGAAEEEGEVDAAGEGGEGVGGAAVLFGVHGVVELVGVEPVDGGDDGGGVGGGRRCLPGRW
ncbi:hypothetical protein GCM10009639_07960 [Kitasatospora putterlickiae]|uniref:Uncharacterized protein n=1 Tax=Kitasatospora putterlickiae TaxID=221725 RepID=A0ABN1XMC9_9ACTN